MSSQQGSLPLALIKLSEQLDMPSVKTWQEAKETFARWGRVEGQERWELPSVSLTASQEQAVSESLTTLGFIQATTPKAKHYDYAIILGGTVPSMIKRFDYLIKQWEAGIRFNHLVFLTGHRPLSEEADDFETHMKQWASKAAQYTWTEKTRPHDESEAAQLIYHFAQLPAELQAVPLSHSYPPPRLWNPEKQHWQRANTAMTIHSWIDHGQPAPGNVLVVSSQPSALYQHQVFINNMPPAFSVETIAPACHKDTPMATKLDAVWLWIKNH